MISLSNKRVFAKLLDIFILFSIFIFVSIVLDNNGLTALNETFSLIFLLFFNLVQEIIDPLNRTFGKRIFKLKLSFPDTKMPVILSLIARRFISAIEMYSGVGIFTIYLNKNKTMADIATGSLVDEY